MTKESDALILRHKVSGAPGIVTDVSTPGAHTPWDPQRKRFGNHFRPGTPSESGSIGVAVDFGGYRRRLTDAESLQVFDVFASLGEKGLLSELYCGQATHCVKDGVWRTWASLPKKTRDAIRNTHYDHIHVAARVGMFVPVRDLEGRPAPSVPQEEDMPAYADKCEWNDGAAAQVYPDGAVKCFGSKFYGSIHSLRDDAKKTFTKAVSIRPVDVNDSQRGYRVGDESGDEFTFEPGVEKFFKK